MFNNAEDLQAKVDAYFETADKLTITGLALHLGFCDRQSLYDYEEKEEFSCIIKKARLKVENGYEFNLHGNAPTGSIFALKNMGWKDMQGHEHTGQIGINWQEIKNYGTDEKTD